MLLFLKNKDQKKNVAVIKLYIHNSLKWVKKAQKMHFIDNL